MEYNYVLTTSYDGELVSTYRISDFMEAHEAWAKCVDYGTAKEYATYNLTDSKQMHRKRNCLGK